MKNIISLNHNVYAVYTDETLLTDKLDYVKNKIVAIEAPRELQNADDLGYVEVTEDGFAYTSSEEYLNFKKNGFVGIYTEEELNSENFIAKLEALRNELYEED